MKITYIYCPECKKKIELTYSIMKNWLGLKCEGCGEYIVINEQLQFHEEK